MSPPLAALIFTLVGVIPAGALGWWLAGWEDRQTERYLQRKYPDTYGPARHEGATIQWAAWLRDFRRRQR